MSAIDYIGKKDGKRSSIRVDRADDRILLSFQREGEGRIAIKLRDDQARELARMLNEAAADKGAA